MEGDNVITKSLSVKGMSLAANINLCYVRQVGNG